MAANTSPIHPLTPNVGGTGTLAVALTAANTAEDGSGTVVTIFTAGANGSRVDNVRAKPDQAGNNIATRLKIFVNDGTAQTAGAQHSVQIADFALPATTASQSVQNTADIVIPLNIAIPASYRIQVCIGTTVANGWFISAQGGDY